MKYTFEVHGHTAQEIARKATARLLDFADGLLCEIETITVDKRIMNGFGDVVYEIAHVTAWVEEPS